MSSYNPYWFIMPTSIKNIETLANNTLSKIKDIPNISKQPFVNKDYYYFLFVLLIFFFFVTFSLEYYIASIVILLSLIPIYNIFKKEEEIPIDNVTQNKCRAPTKDNPYMNPNILDAGTPNANLEACKVDEIEIRKLVDDKLNKSDSLYDRDTSYRYFYTLPVTTIPGDQIKFANFLYGNGRSCKSDQNYCSKYHDLRYQRENPDIDRMVMNYTE